MLSKSSLFALGLSAMLAWPANPASAQTSLEGKSLSIVIGTDAGGGYDLYARMLGRHIMRHLPGKPTIVPQNMPGAGSMKAAEYLHNIAPKDGTAIGLIFPGAILEPLLGDRAKFRYDPNNLQYLGSADSGVRLCITHKSSKVKTFEDAQRIPANMGGSAAGSSTTDYAQMLNALAGAKFKIINGYKSSLDTVLAAERGEVDGLCGYDSNSFRAQRPAWFGTAESNMIVQTSLEPGAELTKMGVPSIWKYVTSENRAVMELILSQQEFHRPFVAPPGVPAPMLATLRAAFMATMKDPGVPRGRQADQARHQPEGRAHRRRPRRQALHRPARHGGAHAQGDPGLSRAFARPLATGRLCP